jgi:hypothetical protein
MSTKELHTSNNIKRYPINLTQIPIAEQYAEQIEMSLPAHGFVESSKLWADEFRRLSRMGGSLASAKQLLERCKEGFDESWVTCPDGVQLLKDIEAYLSETDKKSTETTTT